jgi:2-polyprenyl-6-methoxyphenol hydroxylase-like FAD-dependent oxidoreductase
MTDYDVIVVGGGPVGAALAVDLGQRGVRTGVVERRADINGDHPRARGFSLRTSQHLKRWGLLDRFRELSLLPGDRFPDDVAFVTTMSGFEITRIRNAFYGLCDPGGPFAEPGVQAQQYQFETVCWERIDELGNVTGLRGREVSELSQDADHVRVVVQTEAGKQELTARYLVGCDGARSSVRKLMGASMEGTPAVGSNVQVVFRSQELWSATDMAFAVMYWILQPSGVGGFLLPVNGTDTWVYSVQRTSGDAPDDPDELIAVIRSAVGSDIDVEIVSIEPYSTHSMIASSYRNGRLFLAGDAAHLHPTYGGHGLNTGVSDAADLGWKLAATINGWGSEGLLNSYQIERRGIAEDVVLETTASYGLPPGLMWSEEIEAGTPRGEAARDRLAGEIQETKRAQFRTIGTQLGYGYPRSPCVVPDGTRMPHYAPWRYVPSASPGAIAPHVQLSDGQSIHRRFGSEMTLLRLGGADPDDTAIEDEAKRRSIPLHVAAVIEGVARKLYGSSLVLVRPDQHVAWRGDQSPEDVGALWDRVTGGEVAT